MTGPPREDRVEAVFQGALDQAPGDRAAFVARACDGDQELAEAVSRLLGAHERAEADGFLQAADLRRLQPTATAETAAFRPAVGEQIGRYRIVDRIGAGGMGEVFLAHDDSLDRRVAIKVVSGDHVHDSERVRRFRQEALAASALNHPNILTIHEVGPWETGQFMATEYVEGSTLRALIAARPIPLAQALEIAAQIASALAAAHGAGIVHRDVKPENVMVRRDGLVKVLDFGIAKISGRTGEGARAAMVETATGVVIGTAAYMSPEQARGLETDARTDVWAFGCVLYEMLAGRPAFGRETHSDTLAAVLERDPDWGLLPSDVPARLRRLLRQCLVKEPAHRLAAMGDVRAALETARAGLTGPVLPRWTARLRRPRYAAAAALGLAALTALAAWLWMRGAEARWARRDALVEIARLVEADEAWRAFFVARRAAPYLPGSAELRRFWADHAFPLTVTTEPPGAVLLIKPYRNVDAPWEEWGRSPLTEALAPRANFRLRVVKEGFEPVEVASDLSGPSRVRHFVLDATSAVPSGMVRVAGGPVMLWRPPVTQAGDFWIDRYEVTNREFKRFVDEGGYGRADLWREPFIKDGRVLSREQALAFFRDATGRPGPASWEVGSYPDGTGDHPVAGVSWFEAAAYARFAGKELPTAYHWRRAAGVTLFGDIFLLSNFDGHGTAPRGRHQGISAFGAYDMAGNVKEWCWNASGERRWILGGGWNEPSYTFNTADAQSPWSRSPAHGFRCVRYVAPPTAEQRGDIPYLGLTRDYSVETPASEDVFRIYRRLYAYDRPPLAPRLEGVEENERWRREKVSFAAAYEGERVPGYLFLPRNARPPYQTVVYIPQGEAFLIKSSADIQVGQLEFLLRSGRAVFHPIYKGMYERQPREWVQAQSGYRDLVVDISRDLGRSLDYLETRADIDRQRLAYYHRSANGMAAVMLAVEQRFRAAVLHGGGLPLLDVPPEVDGLNFAPRVKTPVLMLNGRHDFVMPAETSQKALFRLLGTPEKDKRHVLFEAGHADHPQRETIREALDWLDRYLGPVTR